MKFILGRKIGMSQVFGDRGQVIPVTVVEVEPNVVVQVRTKGKDNYEAVQIGTGAKKKAGSFKFVKEFKSLKSNDQELKAGDTFDLSVFALGDTVKVTGISKGKGFQGAVKRHGFSGMPFTHGHHHVLRHIGSIGQRFPQHTLKGKRMAGRMGGVQRTVRGLRIVTVDVENKLLAITGAVPGNRGGLLAIQTQ